jgi:putative oxidoreductase
MTTRLYSSFPSGTAAFGLLLLRILCGSGLTEQSRAALCGLFTGPQSEGGALGEVAVGSIVVAGILIVIGFWTSVAAAAGPVAALTAYAFGFVHSITLLFAGLSLVIALLGPGAFSIDARLFGWKQIRFPSTGKR